MKKLFYTFLILILGWTLAFGADVDFYEDFEGRTVDQVLDDSGTSNIPFWTHLEAPSQTQYDDQSIYIRDVSEDGIAPRFGSQYVHMKATWGAPESCAGVLGYTTGYGRIGFKRSIFYYKDTDLTDSMYVDIDNGTEYWIGWSQYIPSTEKGQQQRSGLFQINSNDTNLSFIQNFGMAGEQFKLRRYYGTGSSVWNDGGSWEAVRDAGGGWIDWVMQIRLYTSNNADARMNIYNNGVNKSADWDGQQNARTGSTQPYLIWQNYNWWHCGDTGVGQDTNCADTSEDYHGCDNTGEWEGWTRNFIIDEIRIKEYSSGQGDHYCAVAPAIWPVTPTISYPGDGATGIDTTVTVTYDGYADHRTDAKGCFAYSVTEIQVNEESDGDWTTSLVVDYSGSAETSHEISGLAYNTEYRMRTRHKSIRSGTATTYTDVTGSDGWSTTVNFTTKEGAGSNPMTISNINSGGLSVSNINSGGLTVTPK